MIVPSRRGGSGGKAGVALGMRAAFEMVLAPLVGGGLGWLIDSATGTSPAFILIGGVLGMIAGVVNATRLAARHVADETRTVTDRRG